MGIPIPLEDGGSLLQAVDTRSLKTLSAKTTGYVGWSPCISDPCSKEPPPLRPRLSSPIGLKSVTSIVAVAPMLSKLVGSPNSIGASTRSTRSNH
ncbi:hypothetical protein AALP_AA6G270200 [Arabis alpina]|uniref:Uncharacterized protein n=1 Tax=Arabis alpina TaxID=50452 RepID=A0A087GRZ4_ARAAL|nr:hypothetical protein AALP_AA6G270200 [Arabis alpina]